LEFRRLFIQKYIRIIIFLFLKIIFDINTLKRYENIKKIFLNRKKIKIFKKHNFNWVFKYLLNSTIKKTKKKKVDVTSTWKRWQDLGIN
jgi:hypothetical protein